MIGRSPVAPAVLESKGTNEAPLKTASQFPQIVPPESEERKALLDRTAAHAFGQIVEFNKHVDQQMEAMRRKLNGLSKKLK